jgi:hypothetical protein
MRHWLLQVLATIVLFSAMLALNVALFQALEFAPGINWVYLPAGMRLLCTLLFAEAGAVGLLIVSWVVSFEYFFPNDFERAFMGGLIASAAPYIVYLVARHFYGLDTSLRNLTSRRLLVLAFAYSLASPLVHHLWFASRGQHDLVRGFLAMFVGDLAGTLVVLYALKGVLALVRARSRASGSSG